MTVRWMLVGLAFAVATSAHVRSPDSRHPAWLVGRWADVHPGQPSECPTQFTTTYHRDGRYEFMDESGRWQVDGNRLIETMTWNGGTGDDRDLNRRRSTKFIRLSRDKFRLIGPEGEALMIRCAATR